MNCPYCGKELPEGSHYCPSCMKSLQPETVFQPEAAKKRRLPGGALAAAALLLAAGAVACGLRIFARAQPERQAERPLTNGSFRAAETGGHYFSPDENAGQPVEGAPAFTVENGVLTRYNGGTERVEVPEGVTAIGQAAFFGNQTVTEIILPDTLTDIYAMAFSGCTALQTVEIPASVERIDSEAFGRCTSLTAHTVDPDNPYYTVSDGILFTDGGETLVDYPAGKEGTEYAVPEGVKVIMSWAFQGNAFLERVSIPSSVENLFCPFGYCTALREITVDPGNTAYRSADGVLYTADGETLLWYPAAKEGESFAVPDPVRAIESNAFMQTEYLRSVSIPEGVTLLPAFAFKNVRALEELHLPSTIREIDSAAVSWDEAAPAIYTPPNETTEQFCRENGLPCIVEGTE